MAVKSSRVEVAATPAAATARDTQSYVDWAAIFAGAALASAISFVLLAFGAAIGLTLASPFPGEGMSAVGAAVAIALWVLWVTVSSFMAGGYLTGRLRRPAWDANPHEIVVRDGAHGLVVWAIGALFGALVAASAVTGVAKGGAQIATAAATAAGEESGRSDPFGYVVDSLFRAGGRTSPEGGEAARREATRILATGVGRAEISAADRSYLAELVAARTGLSREDAQRRVESVLADARQAAEKARKTGILLAFLTAASLLAGAAGAWWAAQVGGRHRDERADFSRLVRRW